VRLRKGGAEVETSALINSGFEADEPQIVLPMEVARRLGLLERARALETFEVAGGGRAMGYRIATPVEVRLVLPDRSPRAVSATATVMPGEREVIISDYLASELGLVLLDLRDGRWCLRDEVGRRERRSASPEFWAE